MPIGAKIKNSFMSKKKKKKSSKVYKKIDFTNKDDIDKFVTDNIEAINESIDNFKKGLKKQSDCKIDETDVKNHLRNKLFREFKEKKDALIADFESKKYSKKEIANLANKYVYYKSDLESFFEKELFKDLFDNINGDLDSKMTSYIKSLSTISDAKKKFISISLSKIVGKTNVLIRQNGFSNNVLNVESGVQTANAGDSAQFLFISRAILAGFNCSNVDVRSSRYDAAIDYKGIIYKVQVKGISGNVVSFKDRDRGGKGIDTHNERNIGKRITSNDCDIFVAVDKQVGICYIIPVKDYVDNLDESKIKSTSVNDLSAYRENWGIVREIYEKDPRSKYTAEEILKALKEYEENYNKKIKK